MTRLASTLAITFLFLSFFVQLRLSSLNLWPISKPLPALGQFPQNNGIFTDRIKIIGQSDLVMPECLAVSNKYIFLSLGDGRIVRARHVQHDGEEVLKWEALVRTGEDHPDCGKGGPSDTYNMEMRCGRPLGMVIVKKSTVRDGVDDANNEDVLIVADPYRGLLLINGIYGTTQTVRIETLATSTSEETTQFQLLNGIASTPDGTIYFTETSRYFQRRRIFYAAFDGRSTGRLLRFTKEKGVDVVADGIYMPNGVSISHDSQYLLIVSGVQILRYSLHRQTMEDAPFVNLPGTGDNIHTQHILPDGTPAKCYWVALGSKFAQPFSLLKALSDKPLLKSVLVALVPYKVIVNAIPKLSAIAVYGEDGILLDVYQDEEASVPWLSEGVVFGKWLYLASWYNDFLGSVKVDDLKL